jgi:hypothetical protein
VIGTESSSVALGSRIDLDEQITLVEPGHELGPETQSRLGSSPPRGPPHQSDIHTGCHTASRGDRVVEPGGRSA